MMTTSAYVFPGQGSQSVGMGEALAAASPAAAAIFAAADAALDEPLSRLAFAGPAPLGGPGRGARPNRDPPPRAARDRDRLPRGRPRAMGSSRNPAGRRIR